MGLLLFVARLATQRGGPQPTRLAQERDPQSSWDVLIFFARLATQRGGPQPEDF
jgi:hypothetical protein